MVGFLFLVYTILIFCGGGQLILISVHYRVLGGKRDILKQANISGDCISK